MDTDLLPVVAGNRDVTHEPALLAVGLLELALRRCVPLRETAQAAVGDRTAWRTMAFLSAIPTDNDAGRTA